MWIKAVGPHLILLNTNLVEMLAINYKGNGNYHVMASTSGSDLCVHIADNEKSAQDWLEELQAKL